MKKKCLDGLRKHSPLIFACLAGVGVVATAVASAMGTKKLMEHKDDEDCKPMQNVMYYAPAAAVAVATIACVFEANAMSKKQSAALASSYILLKQSYDQYRGKVKEKLGEETDKEIHDDILRDECKSVSITPLLIDGDADEKKCTFLDIFSQRYFTSTMTKVLQAEYHLNRNFALQGGVDLNDFYEFLGLDPLPKGYTVGWTLEEGIVWIDFLNTKEVLDDGMEIWVIDMIFDPVDCDWDEDIGIANSNFD